MRLKGKSSILEALATPGSGPTSQAQQQTQWQEQGESQAKKPTDPGGVRHREILARAPVLWQPGPLTGPSKLTER